MWCRFPSFFSNIPWKILILKRSTYLNADDRKYGSHFFLGFYSMFFCFCCCFWHFATIFLNFKACQMDFRVSFLFTVNRVVVLRVWPQDERQIGGCKYKYMKSTIWKWQLKENPLYILHTYIKMSAMRKMSARAYLFIYMYILRVCVKCKFV